jgi:hypothetical protein
MVPWKAQPQIRFSGEPADCATLCILLYRAIESGNTNSRCCTVTLLTFTAVRAALFRSAREWQMQSRDRTGDKRSWPLTPRRYSVGMSTPGRILSLPPYVTVKSLEKKVLSKSISRLIESKDASLPHFLPFRPGSIFSLALTPVRAVCHRADLLLAAICKHA